jgi:hypothetical protein
MNLTSIYGYIERRLGTYSYKTAATIFLISRTIGSAFRLYLVVIVLQRFVFDFYESLCSYRIDFISFNICLHLSRRLKTIIITDTLQTFFLVTSVFMTIYFICQSLNLSTIEAFEAVKNSNYSKIFSSTISSSKFHFVKQIWRNFVTIAMVGLDQDLMQRI